MIFDIVWTLNAENELKKIERPIAKRIFNSVERLKNNPERWLTKLVKSLYFRLRFGDYRIIINIDFEKKRIDILDLGHRKKIYD